MSERMMGMNTTWTMIKSNKHTRAVSIHTERITRDDALTTTHGLRRCELPLRMTSTPPLPAAAMTQCFTPKSIPTTDMMATIVLFVRFVKELGRYEKYCCSISIGGAVSRT